MRKITRLSESDIRRIVNKVINENEGVPLRRLQDEVEQMQSLVCRKIPQSMEDLTYYAKKGDANGMRESIQRLLKIMKDVEDSAHDFRAKVTRG